MDRLTAIVLGAAAGGGFPQWNCRCAVCRLAWDKDPRVKPRTQASLAVSADRQNWVLLNASPDLRAQIQAVPALQPHTTPRGSPIAGVILTGAEVDQVGGLLTLRERGKLTLYGTGDTLAAIEDNPIFGVLATDIVNRKRSHWRRALRCQTVSRPNYSRSPARSHSIWKKMSSNPRQKTA